METLIIKYDSNNKAIVQVLSGLMKMGAIEVEKSPYDEKFLAKVAKGEQEIKEGKAVAIAIEDLWK